METSDIYVIAISVITFTAPEYINIYHFLHTLLQLYKCIQSVTTTCSWKRKGSDDGCVACLASMVQCSVISDTRTCADGWYQGLVDTN